MRFGICERIRDGNEGRTEAGIMANVLNHLMGGLGFQHHLVNHRIGAQTGGKMEVCRRSSIHKISRCRLRVQADSEITAETYRFPNQHSVLFPNDKLDDGSTPLKGDFAVGQSIRW